VKNAEQVFDIASFFYIPYTPASTFFVGWSGCMNLLANRFRRASRLAVNAVLLSVLVLPLSGWAAGEKASTKSKKSGSVQSVSAQKKSATAKSPGKQATRRADAKVAKAAKSRQTSVARNARKSSTVSAAAGGRQGASSRHSQMAKSMSVPAVVKVAARPSATESALHITPPSRVSTGERLGLRGSADPLDLSSSVALVMDQDTNEVLFSKNDSAVLPIASLTKLMTGLVIADAQLPMDEPITITQDDVDIHKFSRSRLAVGTTLSRGELMHLALMSSENRAAHALGRTFPGGMAAFVAHMNAKARLLGMTDTRYVEPTGLLSQNQSSARDLATLVSVAYDRPILRDLSTSPGHQVDLGRRTLQFNNSNRLIHSPHWEIGLQKTGYISEAGRCLVMQAKVAGRKLIMVFLDSAGKLSRVEDAERVRRWVEAQSVPPLMVRPQG
jgi:D-alanyl-D-alanine endopeptidase (penicillin-binding protein 7)